MHIQDTLLETRTFPVFPPFFMLGNYIVNLHKTYKSMAIVYQLSRWIHLGELQRPHCSPSLEIVLKFRGIIPFHGLY